jgi:hypothetical protein
MKMSPDEELRRDMIRGGEPGQHLAAEQQAGRQTWTTQQLADEFEVLGFAAPFVVVQRKSDRKRGTLEFTHSPRVYFGWREDQ